MSSPIREELQRLSSRFLFYGRTILVGVSITAIFFSLYAGLRANYFTIQIITVVISTLSVALVGLFFYFALRFQRESRRINLPSETDDASPSELNEKLIRQLILDVQELTPNRLEVISNRRRGHSIEGGLFRLTFLLAYRVAYAFYSTLRLVSLTFPESNPRRRSN